MPLLELPDALVSAPGYFGISVFAASLDEEVPPEAEAPLSVAAAVAVALDWSDDVDDLLVQPVTANAANITTNERPKRRIGSSFIIGTVA
jgi:hypothetical protein